MILARQPRSTNCRYNAGSSGWCFSGASLLKRPTVKPAEVGSEGLLIEGTNLSVSIRVGSIIPVWLTDLFVDSEAGGAGGTGRCRP
jgi:hypothetical protein